MSPQTTSPDLSASVERGDSCKLVSLLALATGAVAMPQTGHADIFYSDHRSAPITVGSTALPSYLIDDLPGAARLLVEFNQLGTSSATSYRFVLLRQTAGYVKLKQSNGFFAARVPEGMLWSQIGGFSSDSVTAGVAAFDDKFPIDDFSNAYYAFIFKDSTQGDAIRYGWMSVSLENEVLLFGDGPHLTITGWAFDTSGAQISMGTVPEPSSAAVLALGALALGSKGLRSWRRKRAAADKP